MTAAFQDIEVWSPDNTSTKAMWKTGVTTNGVCRLWFTDTGDETGNATMQREINIALANAVLNTSSVTSVPIASIKEIDVNRKFVDFNVVQGITLLALGPTMKAAPDGTVVNALVTGV